MKITFKISNANVDKQFENILIGLVSNCQLRAQTNIVLTTAPAEEPHPGRPQSGGKDNGSSEMKQKSDFPADREANFLKNKQGAPRWLPFPTALAHADMVILW